ncbi:hypothetical protein PHYSODRAFT_322876 [Phytophthora sojae]|uniref:Uncharacterized protein n=1 Tax=Phytophthora sojae (strain P6497) TaxID=1094619 RepID=G4YQ29_PHYSP|nr:hypothetical protein PHYSODRAFT_322876 [Phytophthora sojae]EGZ29344.1 hypothetical protein PHYSODRAFT_322876 [Phytophthora sojae]|eukprot:XP_009516619.1 hypothetical protein PHYSODRAFT_322876 [Phytophthora sojae]
MVKTPRSGSPATAGGRARPRSADAATKATANTPRSVKFDRVGDRDHGSGVDDDRSADEVEMKGPAPKLEDEDVDELTVVVGKSGAPRPIARRLDAELGEVTPAQVLVPDERPITGNRPPVNGDTPNAYKILGQKEVGGAKWVTLERELASPIDSSTLFQFSKQTKRLLVAMGFECTSVPSNVALEVWELAKISAELTKWKRKCGKKIRSRMVLMELDPPVDPVMGSGSW